MTIATIGADGVMHHAGQRYRAALGTGGTTMDKREGDGATPCGTMALRRVFYRADRLPRPKATVPIALLAPQDGWCDDPADAAYNRFVRLPYPARHEALWRDDPLYDLVGVLGWNDEPVTRGRGSAIFIHLARPDYGPTEGCIALARADLVTVLAAGMDAVEVLAE